MNKYNKIGKTATSVITDLDGVIRVVYHNTNVVTVAPDKSVILYTGGYQTKTTKARMNQASHQFDLGYSVYQKDHDWYVEYQGATIKFEGKTLVLESKNGK